MSEIYREAEAAPPGIEPGKANGQTKPQLCVIARDVAEKTGAANSVESVSSRTIPPRSKNAGPDYGPTALLTAVVRYMAECECTPGDLTKMAAVREGRPATVYFVQGVDGGPIKIGHTNNLAYRLDAIQACSPVRLRLLGSMASTIEMELALHAYFTASRLHGEWFSPTPELLAFIAEFAKTEPDGGTSTNAPPRGAEGETDGDRHDEQVPGGLSGGEVPTDAAADGTAKQGRGAQPGRLARGAGGLRGRHIPGHPERGSEHVAFLARSVAIAPDWRARLPAGVTVAEVLADLAPWAVGR